MAPTSNGYLTVGEAGNAAISMPSTATIGDKKMRVVVNEDSGIPAPNATFSYEV